jgi:hypothetical protein
VDVVLCLLCVAYLIPFAVAARNEHERLGWVFAANLLLGWTVVGWLATLAWALRPPPRPLEPAVRLRRAHLRLLEPLAPDGAAPPAPPAGSAKRAPGTPPITRVLRGGRSSS